jgi:hypothetical protein
MPLLASVATGLTPWTGDGVQLSQVACSLLFTKERFTWFRVSQTGRIYVGKLDAAAEGKIHAKREMSFLQRSEVANASSLNLELMTSVFSHNRELLSVRDKDMRIGMQMALDDLRANKPQFAVKEFWGVLNTVDSPELRLLDYGSTHCTLWRDGDSSAPLARVRWPPVLSQSVRWQPNGTFVVVPDFTYFSSFFYQGKHHHGGNEDDVWFEALKSPLYSRPAALDAFLSKRNATVWRGTVAHDAIAREWNDLRLAILGCHDDAVDAKGRLLTREGMCRQFRAIVSVPGNGVWSWSAKFALLCLAVPVLITQRVLRGETWETRVGFLREGEHFLPLSGDPAQVCSELRNITAWIEANPEAAFSIASASQQVATSRLSREAVLRDLGEIIFAYASIFKSTP